jgi:DNA-binding CsgD family transcriptional regulator
MAKKGQRRDIPVPRHMTAYRMRAGIDNLAVFSIPLGTVAAVRGLTTAEREVLAEVLAGASNRQIAERRGTSERTVANQVARLFRHFGVRSRAQLVDQVLTEDREPS